jgi:hypothetical protein
MRHLKAKSKKKPAMASQKVEPIRDPCEGLTGKDRCKCEKKAYKGGVVY